VILACGALTVIAAIAPESAIGSLIALPKSAGQQ
jgi:hypothetical protein